jgi:hypothetical protein
MDLLITIIVAALPGIITAYFGTRFYTRQAKADLQKEFENKLNERKWKTYTDFAEMVRYMIEAAKNSQNTRVMDDFGSKLMGFAGSLWIVGSDEVIRAFNDWRKIQQGVNGKAPDPKEGLIKLFDIIVAMRRDLGYTGSQTNARDLLATFINDMHTAFPQDKKRVR